MVEIGDSRNMTFQMQDDKLSHHVKKITTFQNLVINPNNETGPYKRRNNPVKVLTAEYFTHTLWSGGLKLHGGPLIENLN